jgi:hypothetical protein
VIGDSEGGLLPSLVVRFLLAPFSLGTTPLRTDQANAGALKPSAPRPYSFASLYSIRLYRRIFLTALSGSLLVVRSYKLRWNYTERHK